MILIQNMSSNDKITELENQKKNNINLNSNKIHSLDTIMKRNFFIKENALKLFKF